jgi:microcystin-dependent protein
MADPFTAEIRMFPFNFPPRGWAFCDGQILPISQNTALFSLLGTRYGGDGKSTFALPNLQGSAPMHHGTGPGLATRLVGEQGGSQTVTLLQTEMPAHGHTARAAPDAGDNTVAGAGIALAGSSGGNIYNNTNPALTPMAPQALAVTGGSQPHNNMQPYLTLNFCIALQGIHPA